MSTKEELRTGRRVRNGKAQAVVPADPPENPRDCGRTPRWLVDVAASYCGGPFGLDVAADRDNSVASNFFTRDIDALAIDRWSSFNGRAWLNPPFSRLGEFVFAALEQVDHGNIDALGLLTLADVSTRYWRKLEILQHGSGVVTYRLPIEGRFSCDPPPGITYSTPTRPMAVWILRRVIRAPKRARVKLTEPGR